MAGRTSTSSSELGSLGEHESRKELPSAVLLDAWLARYPKLATRDQYRRSLTLTLRRAGVTHPADLTIARIVAALCTPDRAPGTIRQRLSELRSFLRWCAKHGHAPGYDDDELHELLRRYPPSCGKTGAGAQQPARWLTYSEAFGQLAASCDDGTPRGLRDEAIVRLGLAGLRVADIHRITHGNWNDHQLNWIGKGDKHRTVTAGPRLAAVLQQLIDLDPAPAPDRPIVCRLRRGGTIEHGKTISPENIRYTLAARSRNAGLGHVAPHDLRRSAANILHSDTNDHGYHRYDLLDIQQVLDHSDPATTMKHYIQPLTRAATKARAGRTLD